MVTPFITNMGERPKMKNTATGEMMELDQYGYWCDMGKGKPEVKETSNDLKYLQTKYKIPDDRVFSMGQLKKENVQGWRENHILIDVESPIKDTVVERQIYSYKSPLNLQQFVEGFKSYRPNLYPRVVQFVDEATGETIKGPKYDTTTQPSNRWGVEQLLKKRGVKQKPPIEPTQYEPRDRMKEAVKIPEEYKNQIVLAPIPFGYSVVPYNEVGQVVGSGLLRFKKNEYRNAIAAANYLHDRYGWPIMDLTKIKPMKNEELNKFRNMIRECISEIKQENDPRTRLKESLRNVVKNVLSEMSSLTSSGKPDQTKEEKETSDKMYFKDSNPRLSKTNIKQQKEIETIVQGIDPSWEAYWDDHQQLIVKAQNLLYVRICQRFENSYDVDAMVKLVDRVRAIALTWDQVKAFIKANFSDLKNKTIPDNQRGKAIDNYDDREVIKKDAGPEKAKTGVRYQDPKHGTIKDTKKDDKDYNEPQTKRDEDMPDQPMKQVTEPGKDPESKNKNIEKTDRVKPPKHKNDKKLKVTPKKTPKFTLKKTV